MMQTNLPYAVIYADNHIPSGSNQCYLYADPVMNDLAEHQAKVARFESRQAQLDDLFEDRYQWLTEDAEGIALVLEQVQCYEKGIDKEMFALFNVWANRGGEEVKKKADDLCHLLDECAARMAHEWAEKQIRGKD